MAKMPEAYLAWLSRVELHLNETQGHRDDTGSLILDLLALGGDLKSPDLRLATGGLPLGSCGTQMENSALDLGGLIEAWSVGLMRSPCPSCGREATLLVYAFAGSILSGACEWKGVCPDCQKAHACPSTGFHNGTSHWLGELARADAAVGRPLRMPIPDKGGHGFVVMPGRDGNE